MRYIKLFMAALMLLIVLLAACSPTGGSTNVDVTDPTATPEVTGAGDAAVARSWNAPSE